MNISQPPDRSPTRELPPCACLPTRQLPRIALQQALAQWRSEGWPADSTVLVGWCASSELNWPENLPSGLKSASVFHVACVDPRPPLGGDGAQPDSQTAAEASIAALDLLITDQKEIATLASEMGVSIWLVGSIEPGLFNPIETCPSPADWLEKIAPALLNFAASRCKTQRVDADMDEQIAVQATFAIWQSGDWLLTREIATKLLLVHPHRTDLWHLVGIVARQTGQIDLAIAYFRHVTTQMPGYPDGWRSLATALFAAGRPHDALDAAHRWVALVPADASARTLRSGLLQAIGRAEDAATDAANALLLSPNDLAAILQRGTTLESLGQYQHAARTYRTGLFRHPGSLELHLHLATSLQRSEASEEALLHFDHVREATSCEDPRHLRALKGLSEILCAQHSLSAAATFVRSTLAIKPDDLDASRLLVRLNRQLGHPDRAANWLDGLSLRAKLPIDLALTRGLIRRELADWSVAESEAWQDIQKRPPDLSAASALPCDETLQWLTQAGGTLTAIDSIRRERWAQMQGSQPRSSSPRGPRERLRIAYAYAERADGRDSRWVSSIISASDPARIEASVCSWRDTSGTPAAGWDGDLNTSNDRLDMTGLDDAQAERMLREAGIDVLLDLEGTRSLHRMALLARRPAALQLTWSDRLAGPLPPWMDGALGEQKPAADASLSPHVLQLVRPRPLLARRSLREVGLPGPPSRRDAGLPEQAPVLSCWARPRWIDAHTFSIWMRALKDHPGAVLWLNGTQAVATQNLCQAASRHGIDPRRLVFTSPCQREAHEHWLPLADIHLPSGPVDDLDALGDALAAGLPVLSMQPVDDDPACLDSRSLLITAGVMPEQALVSPHSFEPVLKRLLRQPRELLALRRTVPVKSSPASNRCDPMFDFSDYAARLERVIHERWRQ